MAPSTNTLRDKLASTAFVAFLFAPAVALALRGDDRPKYGAENRALAEFPAVPRSALEWTGWPRACESWHDDHFGLRAELLRAHSLLKVFVLRTDPSPRLVVGRERWIFSPPATLDLWRGALPFDDAELEGWVRALDSRREEFARRGIEYRFVLVPSKAEVYPERLPGRYVKGGPSRSDQLATRLAAADTHSVLDLREDLLAEKSRDQGDDHAYFPLGTHWTERGALAGTRAIVRSLATAFPALAAVPDDVLATRLLADPGDSLALQMYLGDVITQRAYAVQFVPGASGPISMDRRGEPREVVVDQADEALPRALVFHDSFGMPLPPLLGRHFSHALFRWQPDIDFALVERERPDVVLQVLSDRVLSLPPPRAVDTGGEARVRASFDAAQEVALRFDPAKNAPRITAQGGGRVFLRGEGEAARVVCASASSADTFLLPGFPSRAGARPLVHLEFESSVASSASLFFQTRGDPTYSRRRQLQFETHIGRNDFYAEIVEPDFSGRLMFRPAQEIGTFEVRAFEVRFAPD